MARYIDAEKIDFKLGIPFQVADGELYVGIRDIRKVIAQTPTADVAPRSEVAREIFEEIDDLMINHAQGHIDNHWLYVGIEKLKKKYTEGQNNQ